MYLARLLIFQNARKMQHRCKVVSMQDEVFEILEGSMGYVFNGKEGLLKAGENATLPAGEPHTFWNAEPEKTLKQKVDIVLQVSHDLHIPAVSYILIKGVSCLRFVVIASHPPPPAPAHPPSHKHIAILKWDNASMRPLRILEVSYQRQSQGKPLSVICIAAPHSESKWATLTK